MMTPLRDLFKRNRGKSQCVSLQGVASAVALRERRRPFSQAAMQAALSAKMHCATRIGSERARKTTQARETVSERRFMPFPSDGASCNALLRLECHILRVEWVAGRFRCRFLPLTGRAPAKLRDKSTSSSRMRRHRFSRRDLGEALSSRVRRRRAAGRREECACASSREAPEA